MTTETEARSAESIIEAGAGGEYHRAVALYELEGATEGVVSEFRYDTEPLALELVRMSRELNAVLWRVAIARDATLVERDAS